MDSNMKKLNEKVSELEKEARNKSNKMRVLFHQLIDIIAKLAHETDKVSLEQFVGRLLETAICIEDGSIENITEKNNYDVYKEVMRKNYHNFLRQIPVYDEVYNSQHIIDFSEFSVAKYKLLNFSNNCLIVYDGVKVNEFCVNIYSIKNKWLNKSSVELSKLKHSYTITSPSDTKNSNLLNSELYIPVFEKDSSYNEQWKYLLNVLENKETYSQHNDNFETNFIAFKQIIEEIQNINK